MAFMESRGFATDETWKHLQGTVYHPLYFSWWHGPKWFGRSLSCYVSCFELGGSEAKRFGSQDNNWLYRFAVLGRLYDKRDENQLEWDKAHPAEAKIRKEFEATVACMLVDGPSEEEIAEAEASWWRRIVR